MTDRSHDVSRREFLKTGTVAATAAAATSVPALADQDDAAESTPLPTRKFGKTGVEVTMLNLGCAVNLDNRLLNASFKNGIRYLDTADCYGNGESERQLAKWFQKSGKRKEIFLVTKDHPRTPDQWVSMLDTRLEALQTDYIDMFFIHAFGDGEYGGKECVGWLLEKEWQQAADKMRKSGKAKFFGFSTHTEPLKVRTALLENAAKSGWVDGIMVGADPRLIQRKESFNKALDACYEAGVGLCSMKEMRGVKHLPKFFPDFEERGLTSHQAILHAMWSDGRFATLCSHMPNIQQIEENSAAARTFKPLDKKELGMLERRLDEHGREFCIGCEGECKMAAGTRAEIGRIARILSYYEQDGQREEARRMFAELSDVERDWSGADLEAARKACFSRLDFPSILKRAEQTLA